MNSIYFNREFFLWKWRSSCAFRHRHGGRARMGDECLVSLCGTFENSPGRKLAANPEGWRGEPSLHTVEWGILMSVARRSLNGAGVETCTECRTSWYSRTLRLYHTTMSITRGSTGKTRKKITFRSTNNCLFLPSTAMPCTSCAYQSTTHEAFEQLRLPAGVAAVSPHKSA